MVLNRQGIQNFFDKDYKGEKNGSKRTNGWQGPKGLAWILQNRESGCGSDGTPLHCGGLASQKLAVVVIVTIFPHMVGSKRTVHQTLNLTFSK